MDVTGWTQHGHAIPGVPGDPADRPPVVAQCGGPGGPDLCCACLDCVIGAWLSLPPRDGEV
jgi:hypothetical protein